MVLEWLLATLVCAEVATSPSGQTARPPDIDRTIAKSLDDYALLARAAYGRAARGADELQEAVGKLLAQPSEASLARARKAWIASRESYGRTEVFRFSGGPIDDVNPATGVDGPEGRINAWPIDEAFLDYVAEDSHAGLVANLAVPMTIDALLDRNAAADETQVTLGFHAIEFLLWGQDLSRDGPGNRPYSDYLGDDLVHQRRRACLALEVGQLVRDLSSVVVEWNREPARHATRLLEMTARDALGRALSGPATLAGFELASERIGIPLSSNTQEDEHSCFSDNTHRDLAANIEGIVLVLEGDGEIGGLLTAIDALDPDLGVEVRGRLERARELVYAITPPFDAILASPENDPRRQHLHALAGELIGLAGAIRRAGEQAGVKVVIGGGG